MRLSRKQKALALKMFGTADMTRREFQARMDALKETQEERYEKLKEAYQEADEKLQLSGDILKVASDIKGLKLKKDGRDWWSGPCPECGGTDRFYINTMDNKYKCRQCSFAGGLANLASFAWGVHLWDAIDTLLRYSLRDHDLSDIVITKAQANTTRSESKKEVFKDFSREMTRAASQIDQAWEYLVGRGITSDTTSACQGLLGFARVYHHDSRSYYDSVCFAHELPLGKKWVVVGINRRIFDPPEGLEKTRLIAGSKWGFLRLPSLGDYMLIVVEGEINGLSIWQVARLLGWRVDVMSVGSEGAFKKRANYITELAKQYEGLVLWGDDGDVMQKAILEGPITHNQMDVIISPNKLDANDLLQKRVLDKFLLARLPTIAQNAQLAYKEDVAPVADADILAPEVGKQDVDSENVEYFQTDMTDLPAASSGLPGADAFNSDDDFKEVTDDQDGNVKDYEHDDWHDREWDAIDEARLFIECCTEHDERFAIYKVVLFDALVDHLVEMEMRVIVISEFEALLDRMNIETDEYLVLSRLPLVEFPPPPEFGEPIDPILLGYHENIEAYKLTKEQKYYQKAREYARQFSSQKQRQEVMAYIDELVLNPPEISDTLEF